MTGGEKRELTREERRAIRKLVTELCANYDSKIGCLPLGCDCYMMGLWWTGDYCKYFRGIVLPADLLLEAGITGMAGEETRPCAVCGGRFAAKGKQAYCSTACAGKAQRSRQREYMRRTRGEC
jgi:hypothetical protein